MPIKRAAFKSVRQSTKRRARNVDAKQTMKKAVKNVRKHVAAKDTAKATEALKAAIKLIDRTRQKGIIKLNTAARLKSRLYKAVRRAVS